MSGLGACRKPRLPQHKTTQEELPEAPSTFPKYPKQPLSFFKYWASVKWPEATTYNIHNQARQVNRFVNQARPGWMGQFVNGLDINVNKPKHANIFAFDFGSTTSCDLFNVIKHDTAAAMTVCEAMA